MQTILFVSLPYGFTLFSNNVKPTIGTGWFHYLMDLHYSQTGKAVASFYTSFHYLMDLHYSQTSFVWRSAAVPFHYLMDLHYSQTSVVAVTTGGSFTTLWIYTILKLLACGAF